MLLYGLAIHAERSAGYSLLACDRDRLLALGADQSAITCRWLRSARMSGQGILAHFFFALLGAVEYIGHFDATPLSFSKVRRPPSPSMAVTSSKR